MSFGDFLKSAWNKVTGTVDENIYSRRYAIEAAFPLDKYFIDRETGGRGQYVLPYHTWAWAVAFPVKAAPGKYEIRRFTQNKVAPGYDYKIDDTIDEAIHILPDGRSLLTIDEAVGQLCAIEVRYQNEGYGVFGKQPPADRLAWTMPPPPPPAPPKP